MTNIIAQGPAIEGTLLVAEASQPIQHYLNGLVADLIKRRTAEINGYLSAYGLTLDRIMQPTWSVAVQASDLRFTGSPTEQRDAVVDMMARVNEAQDFLDPFQRTEDESAR